MRNIKCLLGFHNWKGDTSGKLRSCQLCKLFQEKYYDMSYGESYWG